MRSFSRTLLILGLIGLTAAFALPTPAAAASGQGRGTVTVTVPAPDYEIRITNRGQEVVAPDFGRCLVPGNPDLPAKIFHIALPPGAVVTEVTSETPESEALAGTYRVPPVPLPRVVTEEENPQASARDRALYEKNRANLYGSDDAYPAEAAVLVRPAMYRKYNLADVRVFPFAWHPLSGRLIRHESVTVTVHYTVPAKMPEGAVIEDDLARTEKRARDLILNYDQARQWYPSGRAAGRGLYDFVIITLDKLTDDVQPLANWEAQKGRTVKVVTTTWIDANYTGYDLAEKMRNFLRDKYPSSEWGIEDVCLAGGYEDVPIRTVSQDIGYGNPRTDYYYAELSLPDSQSWDADGDHKWGENSDPIDFTAEVNVGRIPWSDESTVLHICNKSVAYENNMDPAFKKNILLLGAFFWSDTDNAVLMEAKTDPATHPWMADWTMTRMYEQGYSQYQSDYDLNNSNVRSVWSGGTYAFVNWAGHGSPTSCHVMYSKGSAFITSSDCSILNDNYPAIIFADACSNSDTATENIGQDMLRQGGVGFVGATKVAYGMGAWSDPMDGSSQSMDYFFTTAVTSGDYTQGAGHQEALEQMYTNGLWYQVYYEMFEWGALWGNPDLSMGTAPAISMTFPQGLPEGRQPPGPEHDLVVQIKDGLEHYVPGSGKLFYRYDGGTYIEVPLASLGGDLYGATLPGTRPGDQPEFYFQAEGDGGTTITSPYGAPGSVYSFEVCLEETIFHDDFEADLGWTVQDFNITSGTWERCVPNPTSGQQVAPLEDNPAGTGTFCFVTENGPPGGSYSDYDIDGGPTILTSPVLDLSSGDAVVECYAWYYSRDSNDPFEIDVSNDDGATWTNVFSTMNSLNGWARISFDVGDYVTPTDKVRVRCSAQDQPNNDIVEAGLDDFSLLRLNYDPSLFAGAYGFSAAAGCDIPIYLDAGPAYAGRAYRIAGGLSGAYPGTPLPGGMMLPVNWDWLTQFMFTHPSSPVFAGFKGNLDGQGEAAAHFVLAGPGASAYIGQTLTFAYALTGSFDFVSNPLFIDIEP